MESQDQRVDRGAVTSGDWLFTNNVAVAAPGQSVTNGAVITNRVSTFFSGHTGEIFYRFAATNTHGQATFQSQTEWFISTNLWVATSASAAEPVLGGAATPGTFTLHRAPGATSRQVTVTYDIGGTATYGTDYTWASLPSGTVTLAAGQASTNLAFTPLYDPGEGIENEHVTVALVADPDLFPVIASAAQIDIVDGDQPPIVAGNFARRMEITFAGYDPGGPGPSAPNVDLSYPYAVERDGKLYVGYAIKNRRTAELAVVPVLSLLSSSGIGNVRA